MRGTTALATLLPGLAVAAAGTALASSLFVNHDAAAYLLLGDRLLDGLRLYRDTAIPHQLAAVLLYTAPALLARAVGLSLADAFVLFVVALLHLCALQSWRLLRRTAGLDAPLATTGVATALYAGLFLLPFSQANDFGQREHLFCALVSPYFFLVLWRLRGGGALARLDAPAAGALAAVGVAIKPHFVLVLLACEVLVALRGGGARAWLRTETAVFAGCGTLYALVWAAAFPAVFPLVPQFAVSYVGYGKPFAAKLAALAGPAMVGAALALLVRAAAREDGARREGAWLAACAALASAGMFALQSGFSYHRHPLLFFELLLAAFALASLPRPLAACTALALAALALPPALRGLALVRADARQLEKLVRVAQPHIGGRRTMVLSVGMFPHYSVMLHAGARWSGSLWFLKHLPAAYRDQRGGEAAYRRPEAMGESERFFHEFLIRDLAETPPDVALVSTARHHPGLPDLEFDLLAYLSGDPRFVRAWREFEPALAAGDFTIYRRSARRAAGTDPRPATRRAAPGAERP